MYTRCIYQILLVNKEKKMKEMTKVQFLISTRIMDC